jgi:hypothetical protein
LGSVEDLKSPETEKTPETEKAPETTVHEHNFLLATCTSPKKCSSCYILDPSYERGNGMGTHKGRHEVSLKVHLQQNGRPPIHIKDPSNLRRLHPL